MRYKIFWKRKENFVFSSKRFSYLAYKSRPITEQKKGSLIRKERKRQKGLLFGSRLHARFDVVTAALFVPGVVFGHCCVSDHCAPPHFIPLHPRPASIRSVPAGFSTSGNHHSKSSGDDELFLSTPQQRLLLLVPAPSVIRCFPASLLNLAVAADPAILLPSHREPSCDESPAAPRAITRSQHRERQYRDQRERKVFPFLSFLAGHEDTLLPLHYVQGRPEKKKKASNCKSQSGGQTSLSIGIQQRTRKKKSHVGLLLVTDKKKKGKTGQHRESYRSRNAALHRRNHQTEYHREAS